MSRPVRHTPKLRNTGLLGLSFIWLSSVQAAELPSSAVNESASSPASVSPGAGNESTSSPANAPATGMSNSQNLAEKDLARLAALEKRFFEHDFHSDSVEDRLLRLEQLIFGSNIKGTASKRLENLVSKTSKETTETAEISKSRPAPRQEKVTFSSAIESGINNYKLQRYHHAQQDFEKAISLNPRAPEAYANLGGVLIMLNDKGNAREAFKACFVLHPFGSMGAYAREKLLKLAEEEAYAKTNPQDSKITVKRTADLIDRQSADRANIYRARAAHTAQYRTELTNMQIQKLTGNPFYGIRGNHGNGHQPGEEISNLDYIRSNYLRSDGIVQSNLALTDGNKKSISVYESGNSLKDQLLKPVAPGGAKLRALGTSLYARYYGDGLPSAVDPPLTDPPPPALEANAKSISK